MSTTIRIRDLALDRQLTPGDVPRLYHCWSESGDPRYAEGIIAACEPLATSRVARMARPGVDRDDLMQVARMATWKALCRFLPDGGARFTTFAGRTIDGELKRYFRDHTWPVHVPRRAKVLMLQVAWGRSHLMAHGRDETVEALAEVCRLTTEEVEDGLLALNAYSSVWLDARSGWSGRTLGETLSDPEDADIDPAVTLDLRRAVEELPDDQAQAVTLCYYEGLSQREAGTILGCSQMQVSRLLRRARQALALALAT